LFFLCLLAIFSLASYTLEVQKECQKEAKQFQKKYQKELQKAHNTYQKQFAAEKGQQRKRNGEAKRRRRMQG
jgi:mRNA-degrading endonuclease RelE of RelBE toxin-antitoxin system